MRIVIVGNRRLSVTLFKYLYPEWNIVGAIGGTGSLRSQAGYGSFSELLPEGGYDCPVLEIEDINTDSVIEWLEERDPDLCVCAGWTQIIDEDVLAVPDWGFVGVHASDLPRGRGGAPVNWSIIHGEDEVTLSLFFFEPEVDDGDVVSKTSVPVEPRDDVETAYEKVILAACELVDETLPSFEADEVAPQEQHLAEATYRPQRVPDDGLIDWGRDVESLRDWIRALTDPYPGAFTFLDGDRIKIWEGEPSSLSSLDADPGEILRVEEGRGMHIACGDGALVVTRVQVNDEPRQWADEFAERNDLAEGTRLGTPADFSDWLYTGIRDPDGGHEFETNLAVGETGAVTAVACAHDTPRTVTVNATFDGTEVLSKTVTVVGWEQIPISVTPPERGAYPLRVTFEEDGEQIDSRFLKLFAAEA